MLSPLSSKRIPLIYNLRNFGEEILMLLNFNKFIKNKTPQNTKNPTKMSANIIYANLSIINQIKESWTICHNKKLIMLNDNQLL